MTLKKAKMKIKIAALPFSCTGKTTIWLVSFLISVLSLSGCAVNYSFTGAATDAKTISVQEFYNNTDLGPANMGQTFTNSIKNYFVQNSSLKLVPEEGELQLEGEITDFKLTPIAPTSTGDPNAINAASSTRLTITLKVTYVNTKDDKLSFKSRTFSFYKDFTNDQEFSSIEEEYVRAIFDRLINDIFNASVANW
jgi:hypothetical protein